MKIVEDIEKAMLQLDGHLESMKLAVFVDLDGDTTESSINLDLNSLIKCAILQQLETPHGIIGNEFEEYVNPEIDQVHITQDKGRLIVHLERKGVKGA